MNQTQLLNSIGIILTRDIKSRIRNNQITPKSKESGTTLVKSGKLVNSITYQVDNNIVRIGTNLKYARIHHEGGIIRPVQAQYLAIPLTKIAAVKKPRDFDNTYIANGVIFQKSADGKSIALYALKKQVNIPARPYLLIPPGSYKALENLLYSYLENEFKGRK